MSFLHMQLSNKLFPGITAGLLTMFSIQLSAGPLDIAENALEIATGVEPNVMILHDDSGSMDWTLMTPESDGVYFISSPALTYINLYMYADGDNADTNAVVAVAPSLVDIFTLPTENTLNASSAFFNFYGYTNWKGVWRARNNTYNKVFYNPDTTYTPWIGADDAGVKFTNATPSAVRVDPYLSSGSTFNLTSTLSFTSYVPHESDPFKLYSLSDSIYPASYYTWTDDSGGSANGIVDEDDTHELVEIRTSGTCSAGASCPSDFSRQGTRTDCGGDGNPLSTTSCTAAQELQNFANWYSYYRRRELTAKASMGKVLEPATSVRVGMATINDTASNAIKVKSMNVSALNGNKQDLLDNIYLTQAGGDTPLRQNLEAVGEYFACTSDNIFGETSGLTPAETPDNPGSANNCPVFKAPAGECQQNYAIVMTDGLWNGSDPSVGNADNDNSPNSSPAPFDGDSFADNVLNTLADVAMHYYERDLHDPGLDDEVPTTPIDRYRYNGSVDPFETMHQHMATYTVGFGVAGSLTADPSDPDDSFTWPAASTTANQVDDLRHAAWNGRGRFLSANDPETLTRSLEDIFSEITAGTGAASSVAFNTQNLESGALIFRAFFDTNTNTGSLIAQNVSLTGEIQAFPPRWDAAEKLDIKTQDSSDSRVIVSFDALATPPAGIPFQWTSLNATQQSQLNAPAAGSSPPDPLGKERLEYLRGQSEKEAGNDPVDGENFRDRPKNKGRLGDIVHSTPVFVGEPPFRNRDQAPFPTHPPSVPPVTTDLYSTFEAAYRKRREIVYIGANDGMLHGFDANTGEEVLAYVPNIGFDDLSDLTDPDYNHHYFVDLSPAVNDVFANLGGGMKWNTVLIGGRGAAGPGFFALDVTDPTKLDSESDAKNQVLWEFTQSDDTGSTAAENDLNLGTPISEPSIVMTNITSGGQRRWAAIFGNGYNSASTGGNAELFIVFLDGGLDGSWTQGTDYVKITTAFGKAESADTTTPNSLGSVRSVDTDQDGSVDVVYAGDLQGHVYRFDLSATSTSSWNVQTLFTAQYNGSGPIQPITNRPIVVKHPTEPGFIVIVGTGTYFTTDDISDTAIQSIYGLWDDFADPSDTITAEKVVDHSRLLEQEFTNKSATVSGFTVRTLSNNALSMWSHSGGSKYEGWVINLDVPPAGGAGIEFPGERAVRNFILRGGLLFVNTVIPKSSSACTVGPGGFELGFNPETGGSGSTYIFDLNNDGDFDDSDNVGGAAGEANIVTGIRFDESTPTDSSFIGNRKVTQGSDKSIRSIGTNTGNDYAIGRNSWRELDL